MSVYNLNLIQEESSKGRRAQYATNRNSTPNTSFRNSQSDLSPPSGAFTTSVLSSEEFTHLAELLTREDPRGVGDWRAFADACGLKPYYQVQERAEHQRKSPGVLVLTYFLAIWGARLGKEDTLKKLLDVLQRCEIEHAASIVKRWLGVDNSTEEPVSTIPKTMSVDPDHDPDQCSAAVKGNPHNIRPDSGIECYTCTGHCNVHASNVLASGSNKQRVQRNCSEDTGLGASLDLRSPMSARSNSIGGKSSWLLIRTLSLTEEH